MKKKLRKGQLLGVIDIDRAAKITHMENPGSEFRKIFNIPENRHFDLCIVTGKMYLGGIIKKSS